MSDTSGTRPDLEAGDRRYVRPPAYFPTWQKGEGVPIHETFHVDDLREVELAHWERFGVPGAFINLTDAFIVSSMMLELPPGGKTVPVRHMFETWVFVVGGHGETIVEQEGYPANAAPWQPRSLFGPPLNTRYQHVNKDPDRPARLLMVTNAPLTMNLYHNDEFVFDNDFVFDDRYQGRNSYFNGESEYLGGRVNRVNLIPDTLEYQLIQWKARGHGAKSFHMSMSDHTLACHLSEFEVGTYKKAHRHGPGAHVIILRGQGYSLNWREGEEPRRVDWKPMSMFAPPEMWFHQHFNTGKEPARYLALRRGGSPEHPVKLGITGGGSAPDQIEYEQEHPWIYDMYLEELNKNGVEIGQERPEYSGKPRG